MLCRLSLYAVPSILALLSVYRKSVVITPEWYHDISININPTCKTFDIFWMYLQIWRQLHSSPDLPQDDMAVGSNCGLSRPTNDHSYHIPDNQVAILIPWYQHKHWTYIVYDSRNIEPTSHVISPNIDPTYQPKHRHPTYQHKHRPNISIQTSTNNLYDISTNTEPTSHDISTNIDPWYHMISTQTLTQPHVWYQHKFQPNIPYNININIDPTFYVISAQTSNQHPVL